MRNLHGKPDRPLIAGDEGMKACCRAEILKPGDRDTWRPTYQILYPTVWTTRMYDMRGPIESRIFSERA